MVCLLQYDESGYRILRIVVENLTAHCLDREQTVHHHRELEIPWSIKCRTDLRLIHNYK